MKRKLGIALGGLIGLAALVFPSERIIDDPLGVFTLKGKGYGVFGFLNPKAQYVRYSSKLYNDTNRKYANYSCVYEPDKVVFVRKADRDYTVTSIKQGDKSDVLEWHREKGWVGETYDMCKKLALEKGMRVPRYSFDSD